MRFAIVTPVLNGEKFLDQSILSVVSQTGPFTIRYHVQAGGSKDRTLRDLGSALGRDSRCCKNPDCGRPLPLTREE